MVAGRDRRRPAVPAGYLRIRITLLEMLNEPQDLAPPAPPQGHEDRTHRLPDRGLLPLLVQCGRRTLAVG